MYPKTKNGILRIKINRASGIATGINFDKTIAVPERPVSKRLTGRRNTIIAVALIMPAAVSIMKFSGFNSFMR